MCNLTLKMAVGAHVREWAGMAGKTWVLIIRRRIFLGVKGGDIETGDYGGKGKMAEKFTRSWRRLGF